MNDRERQESGPAGIKEAVRQRYATIAREGRCGCAEVVCCQPNDGLPGKGVPARRPRVGGLLDERVLREADLGLGCGIPTVFAHLRPGETVLDLGSGAGVDAFIAAGAVGPEGHVIGVDMTPEMIERARENARSGGLASVEFRLGDIEALPVADASVDVAISNCVINLAPDKRRVFAEIHRVLKPGGRFAISDVVRRGRLPEEVRDDPKMWAGCISGAIDREAYLDLIRDAGFDDLAVLQASSHDPGEGERFYLQSVTVAGRKPGDGHRTVSDAAR